LVSPSLAIGTASSLREGVQTLKIALGSDHAGYPLKEEIAEFLRKERFDFQDFGSVLRRNP
jgi:hypothetical protein